MIRVGIGVRDSYHRDTKPVRLPDRDLFLPRVHHVDQAGEPGHVFDAREVPVQLRALPVHQELFLLRIELEGALLHAAFELLEPTYVLLDRLEVRQHSTEPALRHIVRAGTLGFSSNDVRDLGLGADEQHRPALPDCLVDQFPRAVQLSQRLLEIDQVDTATLGENVLPHLRVPPMRLVTEVHPCLEKFFKPDVCHEIPCSSRDSVAGLTLRELEALPGLRTTGLLALHNAGVSRPPHFLVAGNDRPRHCELNRSGLYAESTTPNAHGNGERVLRSSNDEGS